MIPEKVYKAYKINKSDKQPTMIEYTRTPIAKRFVEIRPIRSGYYWYKHSRQSLERFHEAYYDVDTYLWSEQEPMPIMGTYYIEEPEYWAEITLPVINNLTNQGETK